MRCHCVWWWARLDTEVMASTYQPSKTVQRINLNLDLITLTNHAPRQSDYNMIEHLWAYASSFLRGANLVACLLGEDKVPIEQTGRLNSRWAQGEGGDSIRECHALGIVILGWAVIFMDMKSLKSFAHVWEQKSGHTQPMIAYILVLSDGSATTSVT